MTRSGSVVATGAARRAGDRRLLLALVTACCGALLPPAPSFADYPIFYQRYTADPSGLEVDGRLYLYASHDLDTQTSYQMYDITCMSTEDLKNWTDHGECFDATTGSSWAKLAWAPVVVQRGGKFFMYYGNGGGGIGVAVSDGPAGPFKDTRGRALVDGGTAGVDPPSGMWIFDPGVLVDDDGKAYLFFGGNGASNLRVIQLGADMTSTVGSAIKLSAPHFFEDSWIHKKDGKYYFSYSTNWDLGAPTIDYLMSSAPTSGWQHVGTVLPQPPENNNNNHHSIFAFGGSWYIAYHNRTLAKLDGVDGGYRRNLGIDRLTYNADGTMATAAFTASGLGQLKALDPYVRVEAETLHREHGIETEPCTEGGRDVGQVENGDWIEVAGVDFGAGASAFDARVASASSGGTIELRLDSTAGTTIGTCTVSATGGWQVWETVTCAVTGATGVHDLYLMFKGGSGSLLNLNWWRFTRATGADTQAPTAPGTPTASGVTSSGVTLSWAASTDDVGVTGYTVYEASAGDRAVATASTSSAALSGLTPSTTYEFYVKARDAAGNSSAASAAVSVTTRPSSASSSGGSSGASSGSSGSSSGSSGSSGGSSGSSGGSSGSSGGSSGSSAGSRTGKATGGGCSTAGGAGVGLPALLVLARRRREGRSRRLGTQGHAPDRTPSMARTGG